MWVNFLIYLQEGLYCVTAAVMNIAGGSLAIEAYKDLSQDVEKNQAGLGMGVSINTIYNKIN